MMRGASRNNGFLEMAAALVYEMRHQHCLNYWEAGTSLTGELLMIV